MKRADDSDRQFAELLDRSSPAEIKALHTVLVQVKAMSDAGCDIDDAEVQRVFEQSGYTALLQQRGPAHG